MSNPHLAAEVAALRDGSRVTLRAIRPDDALRLQAFHAKLSPESVYLRWLSAHPVLTDEEAAGLSQVDYHLRMAFVATLPTGAPTAGPEAAPSDAEEIIGVARYAAAPSEGPGAAEAAVVVADAFQQRGLGTLLLGRLLAYARTQGIHTWVAEINAQNARMLRFIQRGGLPTTKRLESGSWQVRIDISGTM
jgi:RimJ/RimL family protein N-acetyltransferase